jgi:hypothetical protein
MKNNLIFTGLYEVRDENTEKILTVDLGLVLPFYLVVLPLSE